MKNYIKIFNIFVYNMLNKNKIKYIINRIKFIYFNKINKIINYK